jgi:hypothetical protein
VSNKKIASGEVPKAHYNALYKTASPAGTPKEERRYLSTASSYYSFFLKFLASSIEQNFFVEPPLQILIA